MFHNIINNCHSPPLFLVMSNSIDEGYDFFGADIPFLGQKYVSNSDKCI